MRQQSSGEPGLPNLPASLFDSVIGAPMGSFGGLTPESGAPSDERGCLYGEAANGYGWIEIWILKEGAAPNFRRSESFAANDPQSNFKDASGSGYSAYQTTDDAALLKNGTSVDIQITNATGNGPGPFPQRE